MEIIPIIIKQKNIKETVSAVRYVRDDLFKAMKFYTAKLKKCGVKDEKNLYDLELYIGNYKIVITNLCEKDKDAIKEMLNIVGFSYSKRLSSTEDLIQFF